EVGPHRRTDTLCTHFLTQRRIGGDGLWTQPVPHHHSATTSTVTGNSTSACSLAGTTWVPSDLIGSASTSLRRSIWTLVCASIAVAMSTAVTEPNNRPSVPARAVTVMT